MALAFAATHFIDCNTLVNHVGSLILVSFALLNNITAATVNDPFTITTLFYSLVEKNKQYITILQQRSTNQLIKIIHKKTLNNNSTTPLETKLPLPPSHHHEDEEESALPTKHSTPTAALANKTVVAIPIAALLLLLSPSLSQTSSSSSEILF